MTGRVALVALALALQGGGCTPDGPPATGVGVVHAADPVELRARRAALSEAHPEGVAVFPANAAEKTMEQPAWIQEPAFQYFSGLHELPGAILVVSRGESVLFVGPAPASFGIPLPHLGPDAMPYLTERTGVDSVLPLDQFRTWMDEQRPERIWLDGPRRAGPTGAPPGMRPVQGFHALWRMSLEEAFPWAEFGSAAETVRRLRWRKSAGEVSALRQNARASAAALRLGMQRVAPGATQRQAEAAVVAGCLEAGAEGPSFWPWMMSGPNAHITRVVGSFFDYGHLNRVMGAGELLRADVGCMGGGYGGDVGRTVPVSGAFTPEQASVWNLLVQGYLAGVAAMAPGTSLADVEEASRKAVERSASEDASLAGIAAAMNAPGGVSWHLHGVGIESGESPGGDLVEGVVLAYEPMFVYGPDAYYLEDMILITTDGAEILTPDLPYTADEMAAFLAR